MHGREEEIGKKEREREVRAYMDETPARKEKRIHE